jgi:hypothetical protein
MGRPESLPEGASPGLEARLARCRPVQVFGQLHVRNGALPFFFIFVSRVTDLVRWRARDTLFPLTKVQTLELCKPRVSSLAVGLTQMQGDGLDSRWTQRLQGVVIVMVTAIEHTCETALELEHPCRPSHEFWWSYRMGLASCPRPSAPLAAVSLPVPGCNHALATRRDLTKLP